jgi:hypothetical protein
MDYSSAHGVELSQHLIEAIHKLVQAGASHQTISSVLGLELKVVQQVCIYYQQSRFEVDLTMSSEHVMLSPKKKAKICSSTDYIQDLQAQLHEDTFPAFIYSYLGKTNQLHRTSLVTGAQSIHRVPSYQFKPGCCWSEMFGGSLIITGGGWPVAVREVVRIDTCREFAVAQQPPMLTPRSLHAAVYHTQHLYVLGGHKGTIYLGECERYLCTEHRWEALPPLNRTCRAMSGVVVESSLYALGGYDGTLLDLVQKLSLESLTWELMQLRLPHADGGFPCFKLKDTEVYLVVNKTLCSFTSLQIRPLKTLTEDIECWSGASYYRRGTLYCSTNGGAVRSHEIGSLSN